MSIHLASDLRYALRGLLARPTVTLVAILSLALGIGVNTAVFSLLHQVLLRPLPVHEPDRLVTLVAPGPKHGSTSNNLAGPREQIFSYPMLRDLQAQQTPFEGIAAHRSVPVNIAHGDDTRTGDAMLVSGNYFGVLGLQPTLGRLLAPHDDEHVGAARVAVLAHGYWSNALGADPAVVGSRVTVNGKELTVVGVAPAGFESTSLGIRPQVFVPITLRWLLQPQMRADDGDRQSYWAYLFARLKPGVSMEQAQAAMAGPYGRLIRNVEAPLLAEVDAQERARFLASELLLVPGGRGQSSMSARAASPLLMLFAVALLVLLIACLNIANLLLARGAARAGEMAVRASLGASRGRLVRQLLMESALIATLGALCSLPLATLATDALSVLVPNGAGAGLRSSLAPGSLWFAAATATATLLLFGLFPAWQQARTAPVTALRGSGGQAGASRPAARFRNALAVTQVALSMTALALAGLFVQSMANIARVDPGLEVASIATFGVSPARNGYTPERSAQLFRLLEERLAALPGVESASASLVPMLAGHEWGTGVRVEGAPADEEVAPLYNAVGVDHFRTLGIPLLAGRVFTAADSTGAEVAIVNRSFARAFGLGQDPVGKRIGIGGSTAAVDVEIVGLVEDSKYSDVRQPAPVAFYQPVRDADRHGEMQFYLRSRQDPQQLLAQLPALLAEIDPDLPLENPATLQQVIDGTLEMEAFVGTLAAAFAVLATLLAALGLYGVLSYTLAQRTREIGLRLALGAAPARLRRMLLGQLGRMTLLGGLLGLAGALALGRAAQSLLFGLDGNDPWVFCAAALLLGLVAFGAGLLPARRAGTIDPMTALRHE